MLAVTLCRLTWVVAALLSLELGERPDLRGAPDERGSSRGLTG